MEEAVILRFERYIVNNLFFPFDKVYLFNKEFEPRIPDVFHSALVIRSTGNVLSMVEKLGSNQPKTNRKVIGMKRGSRLPPLFEWNSNFENRIAVVPILLGRARRISPDLTYLPTTSFPRYLRANISRSNQGKTKRRVNARKREIIDEEKIAAEKLSAALSSDSYFLVNRKKVFPVCRACRWNLFSIVGTCVLGDHVCRNSIALPSTKTEFYKNIMSYDEFLSKLRVSGDA